ncbi:MAG: ATP-binding protein [Eubacteriales bacterium]|nr:ATP-binding protein [Eubacteriales bacterium]
MPEKQNVEWKESWRDEYLKWICGFANAQGGMIYIGKDDNGKVVGVDDSKKLLEDLPNKIKNSIGIIADINLEAENGKEYIIIEVDAYPFPISYKGKYYFRSGSTNQLLTGSSLDTFMLRKQGVTWDGVPVPNVTAEDLKKEAIDDFINKAIKKKRLDSNLAEETTENLINKLNLLKNDYLTNASILLFYGDPEKYIFGSYMKIGYFESDAEIIYQDEIHGPIMQQVDEAMKLLYKLYLKAKISYNGLQRIERYPFPESAIREALLNAVVHKDYTSGIPIQIKVYDDKLFISNDGILPENWTYEDFIGMHRSMPHNPLIAHAFYLAGYIESWGRGVEKIFAACKEDGIYPPEYTIHPKDITIKFSAPEERVIRTGKRFSSDDQKDGTINGTINGTIKYSENEMIILNLIESNNNITIEEIVEKFGKSRRTVMRVIKSLKEKGILERSNSKKTGFWKINK